MKKILFIDTETGGVDPAESSLLSVGLVCLKDNRVSAVKEILINDAPIKATQEALEINKINLERHIKDAVTPRVAIKEIIKFKETNFDAHTPVVCAGHNINFDISFLKFFFKKNGEDFNSHFSHHFIDTASILQYLHYAGKLNVDISRSDKAFNFFNINVKNRHSAADDALAAAALFIALVGLLNEKASKFSAGSFKYHFIIDSKREVKGAGNPKRIR